MKEKILLLVATLNAVSSSQYPFETLVSDSCLVISGHCIRIPELFVFMNNTLGINVQMFENSNNQICIRYTFIGD